jgi:rod shape-determining protein MreD
MALCAGATLIKAALVFVLHLLFPGAVNFYVLFEPTLWVELLLNTLSAPFLFGLLKLFNTLLAGRREK